MSVGEVCSFAAAFHCLRKVQHVSIFGYYLALGAKRLTCKGSGLATSRLINEVNIKHPATSPVLSIRYTTLLLVYSDCNLEVVQSGVEQRDAKTDWH
jgi:hypothetical protein